MYRSAAVVVVVVVADAFIHWAWALVACICSFNRCP